MAVYPVAAGFPDMSGTYIPTLYAKKLLIALYAATVFGAIANTDLEGTISKFGDTVKIRTLPDITVRDYVKGQNLNYETPEPSTVSLLIDKGKYWALNINTVDKKQSDIDYVSQWAAHASERLKIAIDSGMLADIYDDVGANNKGLTAGLKSANINLGVSGTPLAVDSTNIIETIAKCGQVLDEQNVPDTGRWFVIPAWLSFLIKTSDLKDASLAGDATSIIRNGRIGMVDRFTLYLSNNLKTNTSGNYTATEMVFGHKMSLTFATQIVEREIIPNPNDFGQLLRALQVYGYKVVKSQAIGCLHAYQG